MKRWRRTLSAPTSLAMSLPTKEFAMSIRLAALSAVLVSLAFTAAPGCVADEPEADPLLLASASQSATVVQNLNTAEATFKTAVNQSMATSATAAGVTLSSSGVQMARVPRDRTLAMSATTSGSWRCCCRARWRAAAGATTLASMSCPRTPLGRSCISIIPPWARSRSRPRRPRALPSSTPRSATTCARGPLASSRTTVSNSCRAGPTSCTATDGTPGVRYTAPTS